MVLPHPHMYTSMCVCNSQPLSFEKSGRPQPAVTPNAYVGTTWCYLVTTCALACAGVTLSSSALRRVAGLSQLSLLTYK
jgi:hypothetical protein